MSSRNEKLSFSELNPGQGPVQYQPNANPPAYGSQYGGGPQAGYGQAHPGTSTTVIMQQPVSGVRSRAPREWHTGTFDCCSDMGICLCGCFCPLCLACQMSTDMQESMCVPCCVPGWLIALRIKMRTQEQIPGSILDDCCVATCCESCVMCQLAREIRHVQLLDNQNAHAGGNPATRPM